MMINSFTQIDIQLEGDLFSPSKLMDETNLPLKILAEGGKVATKGRYKGKPSPFGLALIKIDFKGVNSNINDALAPILTLLTKHKNSLKKHSADNISIDIETTNHSYADLTIESSVLKQLSDINANIKFHQIDKDIDYALASTIAYCSRIVNLKPIEEERFNREIMTVLSDEKVKSKINEDILQSIMVFYIAESSMSKRPPFKEYFYKCLSAIESDG